MNEYQAVIGLETHIQLNTRTKAFCSCKTDSWGEPPNSSICPICTGQPGALPSPNTEMIRKAVRLCLAVHADINRISFFDRKNYLYADMPKGYQITQNDQPIGKGGYLDIETEDGKPVRVRIDNLHMEEDAGKTRNEAGVRLIDLNRSGIPLVEMVTKPDLHSAEEAAAYMICLRQLVRWIGISEGNMEKAQLRCDANVSVAPAGSDIPGQKCEIKNINSIDALRKAISYEIDRQIRELEAGHKIEQWTIEWDNDAKELRKMRSKENAVDYRFFREPDLMPVIVTDEMIGSIRQEMPELPWERYSRFMEQYRLGSYDTKLLNTDRETSEYFEKAVKSYAGDPKRISNWMLNEILRLMHEKQKGADELVILPRDLSEIVRLVDTRTVSAAVGKQLIDLTEETGQAPAAIVRERNLAMVSDDAAIREICEKIVKGHPQEAAAYRAGKISLLAWFTGQLMRETKGKADAKRAGQILKELLEPAGDNSQSSPE